MNLENTSCFLHANAQTGDAVAMETFRRKFDMSVHLGDHTTELMFFGNKPEAGYVATCSFDKPHATYDLVRSRVLGLTSLGKFAANNVIDACAERFSLVKTTSW